MNKKSTLSHWFCLFLFFTSFQDTYAYPAAGMHSGCVVIVQPVIAGLSVAATALTDIAHNAYQKYVENNKKEELEKIKHELVRIKNDLQTIKGLHSESFTHQFLKQYSSEQYNDFLLPSIHQEKCSSEYEVMLLEKQISDMRFVLVSHLNQLIENVHWIQVLYNDSMVEIKRAIEVWSNRSHALTAEYAFKVYSHYLLREYLINKMESVFDEMIIVTHYYCACKNEYISSAVISPPTLEQAVLMVKGKKSWLLEQKKLARDNSAIIERYFANRTISVTTFKNVTQKEFDEEFKKRDAEIFKKAIIEQQVHSRFGGGPKKDDDEDENKSEESSSIVKISKDDAPHIFGNRSGHLSDTPANRKLLIDLASKKENFLGIDSYGTAWYGKILKDGKQLWATVRNNFLRNGGINNIPREFNPTTGLSSPVKIFK